MTRHVRLARAGGDGGATPRPPGPAMTVDEVMTRPVVVVGTEETFLAMANLLRRHRISGLPVVDDDERLVGVVSESDLLRRLVRAQVRRLFDEGAPVPPSVWRSRAMAETAGGLMSRPAIFAGQGASVGEALQLMRRRAVRRLPVVNGERRVVGIVTRTDLLEPYTRSDQELLDELYEVVLPRLGVEPRKVHLEVEDGNVLMGGTLAGTELVSRVEEAVRDTPGVVFVESTLRARRATG